MSARPPRRLAWACTVPLLLVTTAVEASPQWTLGPLVQTQQWREYDAEGRRLLREHGTLAGAWLGAETQLAGAALDLRLELLRGRRDYEGQTNRGRPLQTHSAARHLRARLGVGWQLPLLPSHWHAEGWQAHGGVAIEQTVRHRRIADAGEVRGYAERYRQPLLLAGTQLRSPSGWQLSLDLGAGPDGQMRLRLPGRDQTPLPLGRTTLLRASVGSELGGHGRWHWQLQHEWLQLQAGDPRPVTLQGVVVGSARQPRTRTQDWQLVLGYRL